MNMTTPLDLQFYAFFVMVLAGIGLGLLYDVFRAIRQACQLDGLLASLGDILLGLAAAVLLAAAMVIGNWGDLRLYVMVGVVTGLAFYHNTASHLALGLVTGLIKMLAGFARYSVRLIGTLMTLTTWPVQLIWRAIVKLLGRLKAGEDSGEKKE